MKKIALIVAFMMLIPCAAFGMQMLNNSSMDKITGQSGVSIAFDDVQIFINIDKIAYIDSDGLPSGNPYGYLQSTATPGAAGAVYLNNFQIDVLNVNAIVSTGGTNTGTNPNLASTSAGKIPLFFNYASTAQLGNDYLGSTATSGQTAGLDNLYGGTFVAAALTIDVTDRLPALTEGFDYNWGGTASSTLTVGGVAIGIPTMEVYINSMSLTPRYTGDVDGSPSTAANNNKDYGTIEMDGITFTTLSGWVEIAPH